ncbi:MAG: hypothetical protein WA277_03980 [Nitrospirota bacterium]
MPAASKKNGKMNHILFTKGSAKPSHERPAAIECNGRYGTTTVLSILVIKNPFHVYANRYADSLGK